MDKKLEEYVVGIFKLGMMDAIGPRGKPDPLPALREYQSNIKQLFQTEFADQLANIKIMGKSVDEIYTVLRAIELQKLTDMEVTMKNLDVLFKKLRDDYSKVQDAAMKRVFDDFRQRVEEE